MLNTKCSGKSPLAHSGNTLRDFLKPFLLLLSFTLFKDCLSGKTFMEPAFKGTL